MLQIIKRPASDSWPIGSRRIENMFFICLALMQWETFLLGGRFRPDNLYVLAPALLCAALFIVIIASNLMAIRSLGNRREGSVPLTYFSMQTFAAVLAIYDTRLYVIGLMLHYVEYQVIMAPRCFHAPLQEGRLLDRIWGHVRGYPMLVYGGLFVVAALSWFNYLSSASTLTSTFIVHIFDGIFLAHYFVEAFLWKFHVPFYRDSLTPLYFGDKAPIKLPAMKSRTTRRRLVQVLALSSMIAIIWGLGWMDSPMQNFRQRVIDPMHAQNHEIWGRDLA